MPDAVVVRATREGVRLRLRVKAGARIDRLMGAHSGSLKLEVGAAPERGKANDAVVKLLAKCLGLPRSSVVIAAGPTSRNKTAVIRNRGAKEVVHLLFSLGVPARAE
jgi:uncharacterized protein (TIGR00251 family)